MKLFMIAMALVAALPVHPAYGQGTSPLERTAPVPQYAATQRILDAHRGRGLPQATIIEQLYAQGLAPTAANVATVRGWLAGTGNTEQKVALVRLLGSLYRDNAAAGLNQAIARDVRTHVQSSDRRVALAAVQTFARVGYQSELITVLDDARRRTLITDDDYAQEIALSLPLAPRDAQVALAQKLAEKNNAFGVQVLASTVTSPGDVAQITPQAAASVRDYLLRWEPVLPMALSHFGLGDGGRYAEWLHTLAMFEQATGRRSYDDTVWERLNDESTDPRKILGFLTAPEGQAFIKAQGRTARFDRPAERAAAFARQFPGHAVMAPMRQGMVEALAAPPDR